MFNIKKKINLRKILISIFCLIFGLSISTIFALNLYNQNKDQQALKIEQSLEVSEDTGVKLNWLNVENDKPQIRPLALSDSTTTYEGDGYTIEYDNSLNSISAGTTVTISCTTPLKVYVLTFSGATTGEVVFTANTGYDISQITLGNSGNSKLFTYTTSDAGGSGFTSATTEELDPGYQGTLVFKGQAELTQYNVDFFYRNDAGEFGKDTVPYDIDNPITTENNIFKKQVNGDDVVWLFKSSTEITDLDTSTEGIQHTVNSTINFTFDESFETIELDGCKFYEILSIAGFGDFIAGNGQDASNPTIIAQAVNSYNFKVVNEGKVWGDDTFGSSYWADMYNSDETDDGVKSVLTEKDVYGVKVSGDEEALTNEAQLDIKISGRNETNKFLTREGEAFSTSKGVGGDYGYVVYNYGFELTQYLVALDFGNSTIKYLYYDESATTENKWVLSETPVLSDVSNLENELLGKISEFVDENIALAITDLPTVVLTPVWTEVTINVLDETIITFGTSYSLTPAEDEDGQKFLCYSAGETLIANSAVWNYLEITGYEYSSGAAYELDVTPTYLGNIYKITLDNTSVDLSIINSGDYEVSSDEFNEEYYTYLDDELELEQPSTSSSGLSDEISSTLKGFVDNYKQSVASSPLYRKLFRNTNNYIYLMNDDEIGILPTFAYIYKQEILWAANSNYFEAAAYSGEQDFSGELNGNDLTTTWKYGFGTNLTPIYVYGLDLYYEDNDTEEGDDLQSVHDEWYGAHTKLPFTKEPEVELDNKEYNSWIVDAKTAKSQGYSITESKSDDGSFVEIVKGNVSVKFKYGSASVKEGTNTFHNFYFDVTEVTNGSGEFIQDAKNPILRAGYVTKHKMLIDNSNTYWTELNNDANLYGAISTGTADGQFKTILSVSSNDQEEISFQADTHVSFNKLDSYNKDVIEDLDGYISEDKFYYVYNYGHYVSGWLISYGELIWNGTTWSAGNEAIAIVDLAGVTFNSIAASIDENFPTLLGVARITLTPVWTGATIKLSSGDDVTYGANYSLTPATDNLGQKFFCFEAGENLIANSAVWNYLEITGYEHSSGVEYTLDIAPTYLDNAYKITLSSILYTTEYELETTDFEFASDGDKYTSSDYSYIDLKGAVDDYNSTNYPLVENYVSNVVVSYITDYEKIIDGSDPKHEIFRSVYYSTGSLSGGVLTASGPVLHIYLANNQLTGDLPMFKNDNAKIIAWNYNSKISNITLGYGEDTTFEKELADTIGDGTWKYAKDKNDFEAVYVYRLDMFYLSGTGDYETEKAQWYGPNTKLEKPFDEESEEYIDITDKISSDNVFNGWMINAQVAENADIYNYSVIDNDDAKELTISSVRFSLTFEYTGKSDYNPYYYGIKSVQGNGILNQDKKDENDKDCYIVLAKLGRTYDLTIDNNYDIYWANKSVKKEDLYGTVSYDEINGTNDGDFSKTTLKVANKAEFAYEFQTSMNGEISFNKLANMSADIVNSKLAEDKFYYVYNYGHYIKSWKISSSGQGFSFDGNKWVPDAKDTLVAGLKNITFNQLAALMDDYYSANPEIKSIIIEPIWEAVKIKVVDTSNNVLLENSTFASDYILDTSGLNKNKPSGKEIIAFTYGAEDDLIALSAVWDYYNKNNSATDISTLYEYKTVQGDANGAGTYTLKVSPVWVDNIYKVNLTNAKIVSENQYQLTETDYSFNATTGPYNAQLTECVTFDKNIDSTYSYQYYSSGLADDYITELISYRNDYNQGIANGSFDIFRKVYYTKGTVSKDNNSILNSTSTPGSTPEFWIYLANNQSTGALPVFEKQDYPQIFWQNTLHKDGTPCVGVDGCAANKHYIYKTNKFQEDIHNEAIIIDGTNRYLWRENDIWTLEDGHNANSVTLHAYYFRKYYNVEVSTLVDSEIERRGYVTIDIEDNLYKIDNTIEYVGGKYIVIAEENPTTSKFEMKVYEVTDLDNSLITYANVINQVSPLSRAIKLYAGCDITVSVKDQSKDPTAMAGGDFDDMIGYKFSKDIDQTITTIGTADTDVFNKTADDYIYFAESDNISSKNYPAASMFKINVYFEKIIYNVDFVMDSAKAGEFNVQFNQVYSGYKTSYKLTDISVDNFYEVSYFAFAGYKLQENAFKYANGLTTELVLQTYDDTAPNQIYTLTSTADNKFNGTWLRDWFYNSWTAYPVDLVNLGTITIQTEVIEFTYGVKVYETDIDDNYEFLEEFEDGIFTLNKTTSLGSVNPVGKYLENDIGFYYYKSANNNKYALLSSRMFISDNPTTTRDNSYVTYNFLLTEEPTTQVSLSPSILAFMVTNYEDGKIIANDCRKIYIMLEVRELLVVTMQVKALTFDTNNSTRTTTLTNGTNNSKTITLINGQGQVEGYYADGGNRKTVEVYTYNGLENTLISEYDTSKYHEVKYTIGNSVESLKSNTFTVDTDSAITIEYIPKTLDIEYVYLLNDVDVVENEILAYITHTKPSVPNGGLTVGNVVNYSLELTNADYNARVTINSDFGSSVSTNNENSQISIEHVVNDSDMAWGVIEIMVEVYPKNNARININLALDDPSKRDVDDNYGTFSVYIDGNLKLDRVETAEIDIIETRDVHVSLELPLGYSYIGIKIGTYSVSELPVSDGKILLIENFDMSKAGDYVIVIKKDDISATLDVKNVQTLGFKSKVFINGEKELNNLYIGASVEFSYEDQNEERLNYFYYTYNDGTKDVEVKINETTFKVTNDILELYPDNIIKFGVKTIIRHKFVATVVGQQYLEEEVIAYYSDLTPYVNGTYCDAGTQLTFTVKPIGVSEGKFKYDITCQAGKFDVINQFDVIVTLNKDVNYEITISPKQYQVTISENIYNDLTQVENGTPEKVEDSQVNNLNILGKTTYNSETTLEFTRVAYKQGGLLDRELSRVVIENNDSEEVIIIEFIGTTYVATIDGVGINLANYGYQISNITENSNTVKLTYVTLNNVSITVDYKDYKVISGG